MNKSKSFAVSLLESDQNILLEQIGWFIEPYLRTMKITKKQIEQQSLEDLKVSLKTVEQAIENQGGWPKFGVKIDSDAGFIVTKTSAENHFEMTALPILLEHQRFILERIKLLNSEEKIETLKDLLQDIDDEQVREKLEKEVDDFAVKKQKSDEQITKIEKVQQEEQFLFQQKVNELTLFKERSKVFLSFVDREPAATILGAILLIFFGISLIIFVFTETQIPDIISGTFFTILGYFFGQSSNENKS